MEAEDFIKVMRELRKISYVEFVGILKKYHPHADEGYIEECWFYGFNKDSFSYASSRNPPEAGFELIDLAINKAGLT